MRDSMSKVLRAAADQIEKTLRRRLETKRPLLVSIDGRCTSGKSTLAKLLAERLNCNVVHADDFYLRPEQRTPERYDTPGGNMDHERLKVEVIDPFLRDGSFCYRPYDAHDNRFKDRVCCPRMDVTIIEGSYSAQPALAPCYDLRVFLTTDHATQLERVRARDGEEEVAAFANRWIPLEELYFKSCHTEENSDLRFVT